MSRCSSKTKMKICKYHVKVVCAILCIVCVCDSDSLLEKLFWNYMNGFIFPSSPIVNTLIVPRLAQTLVISLALSPFGRSYAFVIYFSTRFTVGIIVTTAFIMKQQIKCISFSLPWVLSQNAFVSSVVGFFFLFASVSFRLLVFFLLLTTTISRWKVWQHIVIQIYTNIQLWQRYGEIEREKPRKGFLCHYDAGSFSSTFLS